MNRFSCFLPQNNTISHNIRRTNRWTPPFQRPIRLMAVSPPGRSNRGRTQSVDLVSDFPGSQSDQAPVPEVVQSSEAHTFILGTSNFPSTIHWVPVSLPGWRLLLSDTAHWVDQNLLPGNLKFLSIQSGRRRKHQILVWIYLHKSLG